MNQSQGFELKLYSYLTIIMVDLSFKSRGQLFKARKNQKFKVDVFKKKIIWEKF